jgi:hypothetical protein
VGLVSFAIQAGPAFLGALSAALVFSLPLGILAVGLAPVFAERILHRPALWTLCAFVIASVVSLFMLGSLAAIGVFCAAVSAVFFYLWSRAFPMPENSK